MRRAVQVFNLTFCQNKRLRFVSRLPNVLLHVEGSYSNMALFSFQEIIDT